MVMAPVLRPSARAWRKESARKAGLPVSRVAVAIRGSPGLMGGSGRLIHLTELFAGEGRGLSPTGRQPSMSCRIEAPMGRNAIAQGEALGPRREKSPSP